MARHQLIGDYLTDLARRLPRDTVDELADGVTETWQRGLAAGLEPTVAARVAIAEFGGVEQITAAFVRQAPGRRIALILLASGPIVGACWGLSLVTARAWTWPLPAGVAALFGTLLIAVVAALGLAATSHRGYRRTRLGAAGGIGLLILDAAMIAVAIAFAPAFAWPLAIAIPASLARIGLTLRSLRPSLTR